MDHTDVRDALRAAAEDLPDRDLTEGLWVAGRRRRRRRVRSAAGVAATVVVVVAVTVGGVSVLGDSEPTGPDSVRPATGGPSPSSETPGGECVHTSCPGDPELENELEWQASIGGYENRLMAAAEQYDNFSGGQYRYNQRAFIVYGTGQPPPEVVEILNRAPDEVDARWVAVPYSNDEIGRAGDALSRSLPAAVWYTTAERDYSGIEVGIGKLNQMTDQEIRDLEAAAAAITDIPVRLEHSAGFAPLAGTL